MTQPLLQLNDVSKQFTLHERGGLELKVLEAVSLSVAPGECLVLNGPSGTGKSTLLKLIYGNYRASSGSIMLHPQGRVPLDLVRATPQQIIALRRDSIGYVSQFLRAIPRVPALDIVAEPLCEASGGDALPIEAARDRSRDLLTRLGIPERLWGLPPATFSGGEQQRINIARTMIKPRPLLLLDEPTASLDQNNCEIVLDMVREAIQAGTAVIGIFHDQRSGAAVASRHIDLGAPGSNTCHQMSY